MIIDRTSYWQGDFHRSEIPFKSVHQLCSFYQVEKYRCFSATALWIFQGHVQNFYERWTPVTLMTCGRRGILYHIEISPLYSQVFFCFFSMSKIALQLTIRIDCHIRTAEFFHESLFFLFFFMCFEKNPFNFSQFLRDFLFSRFSRSQHGIKGLVIPPKSFVKIGITKIFCYNKKMLSSIKKTFGCCSKIFGGSNEIFICCP